MTLQKTILFFLILAVKTSLAQFPNILISNIATANEPSIFVNPKNTNQIVAAANLNSVYISQDAGYTWQRIVMSSNFGVWGDPCIVADTSGKFYYFHLSNTNGTNGWIDRIVCQRLDNISGAWTGGVGFGLNGTKDQDKEWIICNHLNNELYATWTQFDSYGSTNASDSSHILFSKSVDEGNSWTTPVRINNLGGDCIDGDNTAEGAVPAVGPNGEVYAAWANHQKIYFNKSVNGGVTWLQSNTIAAAQPAGWDYAISGVTRCNGLPITAADVSGGNYNGNIYINWTDQRNGVNNTDVFVCKSTDGGNTWSAVKKVNADTTIAQQFLSWMCIDQSTGNIYIVYYDRSNYAANSDSTDVFLAVSKDGASTFSNVKISTSAFVPSTSSFFGDYINISAHNGVIRPIWTRMNNGNTAVYTAIIDTTILGLKINNQPIFELDDCASVYYDASPFFAYKLRKSAQVTIVLYDVMGKQISILKNNEYTPYGKYVEHIDKEKFNLKSGVYFCSIKTTEKFIVKKIVVE